MKPICLEMENLSIRIFMLVRIRISFCLAKGCRSLPYLNNLRASKINRTLANLINNLSCNNQQPQYMTGALSLRDKERRWGRSMLRPSEKNWQGTGMIASKIRQSFYRTTSSKRKIRKVLPSLTQAKWWWRDRRAITAGRQSSGHCSCSTRRPSRRTSR